MQGLDFYDCYNMTDLKVLLPVEDDGLRLDLAVLHINLVAAQYDGDVLAHSHQVSKEKLIVLNSVAFY